MRHLVERNVKRARTLAHCHRRDGELVECHSKNSSGLVNPRPDIGEHDDHQSRQVEERYKPGIAEAVGNRRSTHHKADRRTERHGDGEGRDDAAKSYREVERECAGASFVQQRQDHLGWAGEEAPPSEVGAGKPGCDQQTERDQPQAQG
jgi:hypothetical protein